MKTVSGERAGATVALMVFCIFAMLVFSILILGVGAYRSIAGASRESFEERTSLSYIWMSVKNSESSGNVYLNDFHGLSALYIDEKIGESLYHTIIYHHNGWVYELFTGEALGFKPGAGTRIIQVESLDFQQYDEHSIMATSGDMSVFISQR